MGVLGSKGEYSTKWINAEIDDSHGKRSIVWIERTYGDYFFVVLDGLLYAFKIDYRRIKTRIIKATKSYRVLNYDTTHYLPVASNNTELQMVMEKNGLPRIDTKLYSILDVFGKRESKKEFTPHNVKEILDIMAKKEDEYSLEISNMLTYLEHLNIEQIVTPVRGISEFIKDDLLATDPKFMGSLLALRERADKGMGIITNNPIGAKKAWGKVIAIMALIVIIGLVFYIAYDNGAFDGISSMLSPIGDVNFNLSPPPATTPSGAAAKYPSPSEAKAAIERGEAKLTDFPPEMRGLISSAPSAKPVVTP